MLAAITGDIIGSVYQCDNIWKPSENVYIFYLD